MSSHLGRLVALVRDMQARRARGLAVSDEDLDRVLAGAGALFDALESGVSLYKGASPRKLPQLIDAVIDAARDVESASDDLQRGIRKLDEAIGGAS